MTPGSKPISRSAEGKAKREILTALAAPFLLGAFLLLTSTSFLIPEIWPYDAKRIIQFGLLVLVFLLPLADRGIQSELDLIILNVPAWVKRTLMASVLIGILSVAVNAQSWLQAINSLSEVALLSALVLVIPVIAACRRAGGQWFDRLAVGMLAMTGMAVGLQELIGVVAARDNGVEFDYWLSLMHFGHPRFFNQVQSWTIPLLAALPLVFSRHRFALIACLLVLGLNWYIILMTGARGSFVSIMAATLLAVVLLPVVRKPLVQWQLAGILTGVLIYAGIMLAVTTGPLEAVNNVLSQPSIQTEAPQTESISTAPEDRSGFYQSSLGRPMLNSSGRLWGWKGVLTDAWQNPFLGIGPMNYACTESRWTAHPHNFPLQLAGEWGLLVAFSISITIMLMFWRLTVAIRGETFNNRYDTALSSLLFTALLAATFHSCLSGVLVMPASQVTGILVSGMLLGLFPLDGHAAPRGKANRLAISGVLLCCALLTLGVYELRTMPQREALQSEEEMMSPRMWQNSRLCRFHSAPNPVTN